MMGDHPGLEDSHTMLPFAKGIRPRKTCLQSIRSALNIAAVMGIVPYSLRGHELIFGAWQLPFNVLCTFIVPFLGCYALAFPSSKLHRSSFSIFVYVIQCAGYSISIASFLFCNIVYRGDIQSVTFQLVKAERMLFLLNAESKISYNYVQGIALPLFLACWSIAHLAIDWEPHLPTIAMYLTFHFGNLYFMAIQILILFFLDSIRYYLDSLVRRASSWELLLVHLCSTYDNLADVNHSIQKVYGFPILWMFLSSLLFINCNVFLAVKFINSPEALLFVGWIFVVCSIAFRIFYACERVIEKADEFHVVLYRIIKKDKSCKFINNPCLRASCLNRKSLGFNAAGFGEINLQFFAGMISATVTYSVILLQMGKNF